MTEEDDENNSYRSRYSRRKNYCRECADVQDCPHNYLVNLIT